MSPRTAVSVQSTDREADFVQSLQRGLAVIRRSTAKAGR